MTHEKVQLVLILQVILHHNSILHCKYKLNFHTSHSFYRKNHILNNNLSLIVVF